MLSTELEKRLHDACFALERASSENVVERCRQYLVLLTERRRELRKLPNTLELHSRLGTSAALEDLENVRKAVRAAIEHNTQERNRADALFLSLTTVSGYGAVQTLNRRKYAGRDDWRLSASGVSLSDDSSRRMTVQEAVNVASKLRWEEYVAQNALVNEPSRISSVESPSCGQGGRDDSL